MGAEVAQVTFWPAVLFLLSSCVRCTHAKVAVFGGATTVRRLKVCDYMEEEQKKKCEEELNQSIFKVPWWSWLILSLVLALIILVVTRMLYVRFTEGDKDEERRERRKKRRATQGCGWTKRKESDTNQIYRDEAEKREGHEGSETRDNRIPQELTTTNRVHDHHHPLQHQPRRCDMIEENNSSNQIPLEHRTGQPQTQVAGLAGVNTGLPVQHSQALPYPVTGGGGVVSYVRGEDGVEYQVYHATDHQAQGVPAQAPIRPLPASRTNQSTGVVVNTFYGVV